MESLGERQDEVVERFAAREFKRLTLSLALGERRAVGRVFDEGVPIEAKDDGRMRVVVRAVMARVDL